MVKVGPIRGNLIPTWKALYRKARVLATTSLRSATVPGTTEELVARSLRIAGSAGGHRRLEQKILALWQLEGLAFSFFERQDDGQVRLGDLGLPPEAGPPVHCGLAMAAVLKRGFDAHHLLDYVEVVADPVFARFSIETLGLMLAVYEPDFFGAATGLLGRIGVLRHTRRRRPPIKSFLESVPHSLHTLFAHGYGRALYFKRFSLLGALSHAQRQKDFPVGATVRGVIAAFTLINSRDLGGVLRLRGDQSNHELAEGIDGGMMNSLVLLEWTFPRCLSLSTGVTNDGSRRIDEAAQRAAAARRRGLGPPLAT